MSAGNSDTVWKALYEADVYRRYYGHFCDQLARRNRWFDVASVLLAVVAIFGAGLGQVTLAAVMAGLSGAVSMIRYQLRYPDRVATARYIANCANDEFDRMRILWDERSDAPVAAAESIRRVSQVTAQSHETADAELLKSAEDEVHRYWDQVRGYRPSSRKVDAGAAAAMQRA
jgi:hypothetical protein